MKPDQYYTRGFTLVEMVIVIIVISIMAAVLAPIAMTSLSAYNATQADVVVLDKLRYATERLAREVREVNYDATTGFAFVSMGANSMQFSRDYYDSSGTTSTATVTIGNTGSAVTLNYSTGGGTQVLTDELGSITNLVFTYLDANGTALVSPTATTVYSVRIDLTLRHNNNDYLQRTQVQLKNRL